MDAELYSILKFVIIVILILVVLYVLLKFVFAVLAVGILGYGSEIANQAALTAITLIKL